eukprot:5363850-Prymnesium_polylepis.2
MLTLHEATGCGVTGDGFQRGWSDLASQKNVASCDFFRRTLKSCMAPKKGIETNAFASCADSSALIRFSRSFSAASKRRPPPSAMRA